MLFDEVGEEADAPAGGAGGAYVVRAVDVADARDVNVRPWRLLVYEVTQERCSLEWVRAALRI